MIATQATHGKTPAWKLCGSNSTCVNTYFTPGVDRATGLVTQPSKNNRNDAGGYTRSNSLRMVFSSAGTWDTVSKPGSVSVVANDCTVYSSLSSINLFFGVLSAVQQVGSRVDGANEHKKEVN